MGFHGVCAAPASGERLWTEHSVRPTQPFAGRLGCPTAPAVPGAPLLVWSVLGPLPQPLGPEVLWFPHPSIPLSIRPEQ